MKRIEQIIVLILSALTAIIGYGIHKSVFWAICDFIFFPVAWIKWLICQEVSVSIIKQAFSFFFN
jgi:hypothetical protein